MSGRPENWARTEVFGTDELRRPASVDELQEIVSQGSRIRALGSAHSFNRIADTTGQLVSTAGLPPVVEIDKEHARVRVAAGVRYGELAERLYAEGYALHNLGSLPHISVGGACATATHGSGDRNGNLATAVTALDIVTASGELTTLRRGEEDFAGAVVGLGGLGIVTALELEIVPAFEVAQYVYEDIPARNIVTHFEDIFTSAYSVSVFTDWRGGLGDRGGAGNKVWQKKVVGAAGRSSPGSQAGGGAAQGGEAGSGAARGGEAGSGAAGGSAPGGEAGSGAAGGSAPGGEAGSGAAPGAGGGAAEWVGGRLAEGQRNPVPGAPAASATDQLGVPGPWHERLPHFRLAFTPSSGEEIQSEHLVPRAQIGPALEAVARLGERIAPILQISEIRTIAPDDLWMSMSYQRDTVGLHFTWVKDTEAVTPVVTAIEEALAPFGARPHWGKVFTTPPETIRELYPRWEDFRALLQRYDPGGKFRNEFMDRYFPAEG